MASVLEITVNGKRHRVAAERDTPLLYVLRNELGLNGPKFGCGLANAIFDATGARVRAIPLTPARVREALA